MTLIGNDSGNSGNNVRKVFDLCFKPAFGYLMGATLARRWARCRLRSIRELGVDRFVDPDRGDGGIDADHSASAY